MARQNAEQVNTIPNLLRRARAVYAEAVVASLAEKGFTDLPRNGSFFLAGVARYGESLSPVVAELGVSRQAVSQLTDLLVLRGYVERRGHEGDRRRVVLDLTDRGRQAVDAIRAAIASVDRQLAERVPARDLAGFTRTLQALSSLRGDAP